MIKLITFLFTLFIISIIAWADSGNAFEVIQFMMQMPHADKLAHFLLLGTLSFFVNLSLECRQITIKGKEVMLGSLLIATVITVEEFSQIFIPHRNFEILDMVSNYAGIFLFSKFAILFYVRQSRKAVSV